MSVLWPWIAKVRLSSVVLVCLMLVTVATSPGAGAGSGAGSQEHRERKAHLVKKYLKRLKKRDGLVRLVDGKGDYEGNVEILHAGRWGSVCDDEWDLREASVVCRQLGFDGVDRVTHSSRFGPARRKYWMDNMYCVGEERELAECRFDGWGESDCSTSEAAGVVCQTPEQSVVPPEATTLAPTRHKHRMKDSFARGKLKLRLAGGRIPEEGRVEIKIGDSAWGLVCGDGWSLLEAMVVCKELGLGYANTAVQTNFFGGNASSILVSGVECRGNESTLAHCMHDNVDKVTCPGKGENIAAVICISAMSDLVIDHLEIMRTAHLQDSQLFFLQCAMEENCLASQAYKVQKDNTLNWHLESRRLLRFTARILNAGTADFRPMIPKEMWEFHQCHMHYHSMEVFATFDVLNGKGVKVAEGHKASFCLEDNQCLPGVKPMYACANFGDQGISVNCSDIYRHNIDCQWVDISELTPGSYTFKVSINPEFKVAEMSYENNAAVCDMYYSESAVLLANCTVQRP